MKKKPIKHIKWNIATKKTLELHRRINDYLRETGRAKEADLIDTYEDNGVKVSKYKEGENAHEDLVRKSRSNHGIFKPVK